MSNILCDRKNDRWIRHHTSNIITNTDSTTRSLIFNQYKKLFKMTIAKSKFKDTDTSIIGYFQWSWTNPNTNNPNCVNTSVAFSGWADSTTALQQSNAIYGSLSGNKYISLGGGYGADGTPNAGKFNSSVLTNILNSVNNGNFSQYNGIVFDVEYCDTAGLYPSFQQVFAAAKTKNLSIILSVGHSGNINDIDTGLQDTALMNSFLTDSNIDYLSPQLYSSGSECAPQTNVNGLSWSAWANSGKKKIVAIPWAQQYEAIETWATTQGMSLSGFIQWNNAVYPSSCSGGGGGGGNLSVTLNIYNNTAYTLTISAGTSNLTPSTTTLVAGQSLLNATTASSSSTINTVFATSTQNSGDISYAAGTMGVTLGWGDPGNITMTIIVNGITYGPFSDGSWHQLTSNFSSGSIITVTYS